MFGNATAGFGVKRLPGSSPCRRTVATLGVVVVDARAVPAVAVVVVELAETGTRASGASVGPFA